MRWCVFSWIHLYYIDHWGSEPWEEFIIVDTIDDKSVSVNETRWITRFIPMRKKNCRCWVFSGSPLPLCLLLELDKASQLYTQYIPPSFSSAPASGAPFLAGHRGSNHGLWSLFPQWSDPNAVHSASIWPLCCPSGGPGAPLSQRGPHISECLLRWES